MDSAVEPTRLPASPYGIACVNSRRFRIGELPGRASWKEGAAAVVPAWEQRCRSPQPRLAAFRRAIGDGLAGPQANGPKDESRLSICTATPSMRRTMPLSARCWRQHPELCPKSNWPNGSVRLSGKRLCFPVSIAEEQPVAEQSGGSKHSGPRSAPAVTSTISGRRRRAGW